MKKSVLFIVGLIGMVILLTTFVITKTSEAKAINAGLVELTFNDGTTAMAVPITPYLDGRGRACAINQATGEVIHWRLYKRQEIAYSCHCTSCGTGFSTRTSSLCCVTCLGCGIALDAGFCQPSACAGCCCNAFLIP